MIPARHRSQLLMMLGEAAEIEHCLMCCYLYAAFSLKQSAAEDLEPAELAAVRRWRGEVISIATDEMLHLALANNLAIALGGRPHLRRFNFPIAPGLFPADVVVELAPFDEATLDHFVYLERPRDAAQHDAERLEKLHYTRQVVAGRLMPFADDYATVGELYESIGNSLRVLTQALGEAALFVGSREAQLSAQDFGLAGLQTIGTLDEALAAVAFIVHQGEGSPQHQDGSHFSRFCAIRQQWQALKAARAGFTPQRSVARNPVMRSPIVAGRVQIVAEPASSLLDVGNVCNELMLHILAVSADICAGEQQGGLRRRISSQTLGLMHALGDIGSLLTTLPAHPDYPGIRAGLTFTVSRTELTFLTAASDAFALGERYQALAERLTQLSAATPQLARHAGLMQEYADFWNARYQALGGGGTIAKPAAPAAIAAPSQTDVAASDPSLAARPAEIVEGRDAVLVFDAQRCIHSRHCVLDEPAVFLANTPGDWLIPDAATPERLSRVALNCPSGAISIKRKDGMAEAAPAVNVVRVRENGPLAFHAELDIAGHPPVAAAPHRATLCRCGESRNKPFCDGSHATAKFTASGEPPTRPSPTLSARNGRLRVEPLSNGPLNVSGNLEVCSGTGRTVDRLESARFCRCGHSQNKPFCDGSHAAAGFQAAGV